MAADTVETRIGRIEGELKHLATKADVQAIGWKMAGPVHLANRRTDWCDGRHHQGSLGFLRACYAGRGSSWAA